MDPGNLQRDLLGARLLTDLTWRRRLAIVVWITPVLFALATIGFALESALYVGRSVAVEGTVAERHERPGETIFDRRSVNYEPIFTYELEGEQHRASVGSGHSSFDIAIGETATIRAIPGDRGNVRMDTWQGLWFIPAILGLFTLGALVVALPLWLSLHRFVFRRRT